jgi:hypothetical protein
MAMFSAEWYSIGRKLGEVYRSTSTLRTCEHSFVFVTRVWRM